MKKLYNRGILRNRILIHKLFLSLFISSSFLAESGPKDALIGAGKYVGDVSNSVIQGGKAALQNIREVFDVFNGKTLLSAESVELSNSSNVDHAGRSNGNNESAASGSNIRENLNNNHSDTNENNTAGNTNSTNRGSFNGGSSNRGSSNRDSGVDNNSKNGSTNNGSANNGNSKNNNKTSVAAFSQSHSDDDFEDMPSGNLTNINKSSSQRSKNKKNQMIRNNSNDSDIEDDESMNAESLLQGSDRRSYTNTSPAKNLTLHLNTTGAHDNSPSAIAESQDRKDITHNNTQEEAPILDIDDRNKNNNNGQSVNAGAVLNNTVENSAGKLDANSVPKLDEEEENILGILFDENAQGDENAGIINQILAGQELDNQGMGNVVVENIVAIENGDIENRNAAVNIGADNVAVQNILERGAVLENANNANIDQQPNIYPNNQPQNIVNAGIMLNEDRGVQLANNRANAIRSKTRNSHKTLYSGYNQTNDELQSDPSILYRLHSNNAQDSQFLLDKISGVEYRASSNKNTNSRIISNGEFDNITDFGLAIKSILQQRNEWGFLSVYGSALMIKAAEIAEKLAQLDVENSSIDISSNIDKAHQENLNKRTVALIKTAKTPKNFKTKEEKIIYAFNILNMAKEQTSFEKVYELLDKEKKLNPEKNYMSNSSNSDNEYNANEYNTIIVSDSNVRQQVINKSIDKNELRDLYQEILDIIKYAFIGNKYAYPVFLEIIKKGKKLGEFRLKDNSDLASENTINDKTIFIQ